MQELVQLLPNPWFWLIYFGCAMLIGMSKTGVQNIGTLTVPLFALIFGAKVSTGIVLILLCMADLIAVIYYRKKFLWSEVKKLLPLSIIGLLLGLLLGNYVDDKLFKIAIGFCILIGIAIMLLLEQAKKSTQENLVNRPWYAPLFGLILGFSTMVGNAAGPALSVYMLSKRLDKYTFAATSAWFIFILNLTKIPLQAFVWNNISMKGLYLNLLALPFILLGGFIGIKIIKIIPEKTFRFLILSLVVLSSILLIVL